MKAISKMLFLALYFSFLACKSENKSKEFKLQALKDSLKKDSIQKQTLIKQNNETDKKIYIYRGVAHDKQSLDSIYSNTKISD